MISAFFRSRATVGEPAHKLHKRDQTTDQQLQTIKTAGKQSIYISAVKVML